MRPRKVIPGWRRTTPSAVRSPGVWIGSGMEGIDGLAAGDPVTAEQMRALFGCGLHPLAELRQQQLEGPDLTSRDFQESDPAGSGVQDRRWWCQPVPARGGQDVTRRSRRRPACRRALRCRLLTGRGCGPRWPGSSSSPSMPAIPSTRWELAAQIAKISRPANPDSCWL